MIRHSQWLVVAVLLVAACATPVSDEEPRHDEVARSRAPARAPEDLRPSDLVAFARLPARFESTDNPITEAKVALGRQLYFDTRLSLSGTMSCNTCHDLTKHGVDPRPGAVSLGYRNQAGARNSPSVLNAAGLVAQFWDGRAPNVEEQAKGPIVNPKEMAMLDAAHVVAMVASIPGYVEAFRAAFPGEPDPVTYDNVGHAIGAYERTLVTPSRFDRFLGGERDALTVAERRGLRTFMDSGCTACHGGALLGGASFQKLGVTAPYDNMSDLGRFSVTHDETDRMVFRVASLRNVAGTAPYFHDGNIRELGRAVRLMGQLQLGRELSEAQTNDIITFLGALSADPDPAAINPPPLPPNGPNTPAPVP